MSSKQDTLLEFPCEFPIKITGKNNPEFKEAVEKVLKNLLKKEDLISITEQISAKGNYLALTVLAKFYDKNSLDNLYINLGKEKEVLMLL